MFKKNNMSKKEIEKLSMSLDKLSWIVRDINPDDIRKISDYFRLVASSEEPIDSLQLKESKKSNKAYLIGVLPGLFEDKKLFPINDDISNFASDALGLEMTRKGKRSRYEIIGKIVCETNNLSEAKLNNLVQSLELLAGSDTTRDKLAKRKTQESELFSWNKALQEL
jgi:hypothetical protein